MKKTTEDLARESVARELGIPDEWLRLVFHIESRNNPRAVNPITGASGLIQFMPATARGLGTTVEQIRNMNYIEQLTLVKRYLAPYKSKIKSAADVYLTVFYPYAVGRPDTYVMGSESRDMQFPVKIWTQNPGFRAYQQDKSKRYYVKGDIVRYVNATAKQLKIPVTRKNFVTSISEIIKKLFYA